MANDQVLVIGAGPTGMTAAIELTRAGFPVRIIDKSDHMARWSQALVVQARTLEQFQRYGIADEAVARGRKVKGGRVWSDGKEIAHVDLSGIPSRYPYLLFLPQTETEAILNDCMEGMGVKTERQTELTGFEQQDGTVRVRLRHADGREEETSAGWLLGCDGAHSAVRHLLDVPFEGVAVGLSFMLGDLVLQGEDVPSDELTVHFHHGGDVVFLAPLSNKVTRVIVAFHGEEQGNWLHGCALQIEDFQRELDRCGVHVTVTDAEWMTPFFVNDRQAKRYRTGRAFLAGDASHIHSPVAGQGMNTGIQDVANLVWKMAAVRRGASESLLDTYEEERGAVGRQLLQFTERVLRVGTSPSRIVEGVRDLLAPLVTRLEAVRRQAAGFVSETAIHYRQSSAVADHGGDGELRAGDRFPDLVWASAPAGTLLDDWTEPLHLALLLNGSPTHAEELRSGLRHARIVRLESAQLDNDARHSLGASEKLVIVRPDGYVGYRGPLMPHQDWLRYVQQDALA